MLRRSALDLAALAAIFIAALIAAQRLAGGSPIVWVDTFNDEREVRQCLDGDSCTLVGVQTSIRGLAHAAGWLELRTLLAWLGIGLDGVHLIVRIATAAAAVLVFHLATRLGGPLAGAVAAWLFLDGIDALVRVTALHNSNLLFPLGAVFVLACAAAVARPGALSVGLAALVGAVMANVHIACLLAGVSVVWVALAAPRRRVPLALFGAAAFAFATVLIAPGTWLADLIGVLERSDALASNPGAPLRLPHNATLAWGVFAVAAWALSCLVRTPSAAAYRRRALSAVAVAAPLLAALALAPRVGVPVELKYLAHGKAAVAVGAALPLALLAGLLLRALPRARAAVERAAPFAAALLIGAAPFAARQGRVLAADERVPTVADLAAASRILRDERGWSTAQILERLRSPHGVAVLAGVRELAPRAGDRAGRADAADAALLLVFDAAELPAPLPASWRIVGRSPAAVSVLVLLRSPIDWSGFELCVQAAGRDDWDCQRRRWQSDDASGAFVAGMPPSGESWRGRLRLALPLRATGADAPQAILMPRLPFVCAGRIAAAPAGAELAADARGARLAAAPAGTIALEWDIGGAGCDVLAYDGTPPFFVAGDAATVDVLAAIWRRRGG